ncbi:MAG: helix-turn-helix transcriptional regulator [Solirubrobacteraceae bacterium]
MTVSSPPDATSELIGRNEEVARVDALLYRVRDRGGALVIRGEPGIGKSALLDRARGRASSLGARTLATVGVESESELAFAGLHQLLGPIGSHIERLPDPQRQALDAAFGVADLVEADPFRVALAAYRLVSDAADSSPLLLIADDAQWLDRSSLDVLSFIARRLENEPVVFIAGVRDGFSTALEEAGLPILQLGRLSASDSEKLLDRVAPGLPPHVRGRVLAQAGGNPLGLMELARVMPQVGDPAELLSPTPAALTARLERAFGARLDGLGEDTRLVLLAAALDGKASIAELLSAATRVCGNQVALSALDGAAERGLAQAHGSEVRFQHPLIRSAVQSTAPPAQRLAMYAALAEVVRDPERRPWHRAACAVGPDEEVASALEEQAQIARRRGAVMVAAAALERAAMLTADPRQKGERLVRAAELVYDLGRVDVVSRLLREAESLEVGPLEAARLAWLQQMISGDVWFEKGAAKTFVTIAEQLLAGGDPDAALRSLVPIAHRCWWTRTHARTRQYIVDAAEGIGFADHDPRLLVVVALANPELTAPSVRRRVAESRLAEMTDPVAAMYVGIAAEKAGDFAAGSRFLARAVERLREQSRLGMLTQALVHYAWAATYAGDWEAAERSGAEAAALARETRQPQFGLTGELLGALAAALRGGSETDLDAMLAEPERALTAMKGGPLLAPAHLARGAAALGEGRHDDAFRALWAVFDEDDPAYHRFMRWPAVLDLVEAGGRGEHAAHVTQVMGELEQIARRSAPPILSAGLACARPLMSDDDHAEAHFVAALGEESRSYPFLRARTLFSFGRWLRRQRRSAESRAPLRDAINLFDALGATRWSERARQELRASGEKIGPRTPDARDRLTAQELQIAQLAAAGLSNREIGERLFLSHRTIGSHLYRIFPKLGITARSHLPAALEPQREETSG